MEGSPTDYVRHGRDDFDNVYWEEEDQEYQGSYSAEGVEEYWPNEYEEVDEDDEYDEGYTNDSPVQSIRPQTRKRPVHFAGEYRDRKRRAGW